MKRERDGYATDSEHDPLDAIPAFAVDCGNVLLRLGAVCAGGGVRESAPAARCAARPGLAPALARAAAAGGDAGAFAAGLAWPADRRRGRRRRERRGHGKNEKRRPHWRPEKETASRQRRLRVRARLGVDAGSGFEFRVGFGNRGGRDPGDAPVYDRAVRRAGRRRFNSGSALGDSTLATRAAPHSPPRRASAGPASAGGGGGAAARDSLARRTTSAGGRGRLPGSSGSGDRRTSTSPGIFLGRRRSPSPGWNGSRTSPVPAPRGSRVPGKLRGRPWGRSPIDSATAPAARRPSAGIATPRSGPAIGSAPSRGYSPPRSSPRPCARSSATRTPSAEALLLGGLPELLVGLVCDGDGDDDLGPRFADSERPLDGSSFGAGADEDANGDSGVSNGTAFSFLRGFGVVPRTIHACAAPGLGSFLRLAGRGSAVALGETSQDDSRAPRAAAEKLQTKYRRALAVLTEPGEGLLLAAAATLASRDAAAAAGSG